ncbi:MAG: mechanosensitive ion channel domain-containing protein, partial [Bryobacteraceae bacterium]
AEKYVRGNARARIAILNWVRRRSLIFLVPLLAFAATPTAPSTIRAEDVIGHLEQTIAWYRHLIVLEQSSGASGDVLLRESTHQTAIEALRLGFTWARAEAALLIRSSQPQAAQTQNAPAPSSNQNLQQAAGRAADRVTSLQSRISDLDAQVKKAPARQRAQLTAQREELDGELQLAKEIQKTIQDLVNFNGNIANPSGGTVGILTQIDELERSVPEARAGQQSAPAAALHGQTSNPQTFNAANAGLVSLATELISMHGSRTQVQNMIKETDGLAANIDRVRTPLVNEARDSIRRSDELANTDGQTPDQLAAARRELTSMAGRFRQISTAIVPLGEQAIAVGTTRSDLQETVDSLDRESGTTARYLIFRAGGLVIAIFVVLLISELWRRATFKYVRDARRRRQFLVLRRIVVACAIILTVVLGFVTEFGSLATYAGFVTAGVAVALQNPILSIVAYFFLIGRYGIRAGDRVTIAGVQGEVIDIGLMRTSLVELAGSGADLHPTSRIVVFSNSVVFQPAAMFKQMPGIDYVWHTVSVMLTPESDFDLAAQKLNAAIDSVYGQYRDKIEKQHAALSQSVDVQVPAPHPDTRLRLVEGGLRFTARYPAELKEAASIDERMIEAMRQAVAKDPKLMLAPSGEPKIEA